MVPEPDGQPSLDDFPDRLFDRLPRRLRDDAKDLLDLLSGHLGKRPSGQLLGDGIEIVHATRWSAVITPSPMQERVIRNHSCPSKTASPASSALGSSGACERLIRVALKRSSLNDAKLRRHTAIC